MNSFKVLNQKLNIEEIVSEYLTIKGSKILCPFHNDSNPSMIINHDTNRLYCFTCEASVDVIGFVSHMENIPMVEAAKMLADKVGESFYAKADPVYSKRKEFVQEAVESINDVHINYLKNRGIETDAITYFSLGGVKKFGHINKKGEPIMFYKDAVVQPIYENKRLVMYNIRSVDGTVHYVEPGANKEEYLGNIDEALKLKGPVLVSEGFFDCIQAWAEELPCVCIFGKSMSETQATKLTKHYDNIILALDNDEPGHQGALKAFQTIKKVSPGCEVSFAEFSDGKKDLGEHLYDNYEVNSISFYEWSKKVDLSYRQLMETIYTSMSPLEQRKNLLLLAKDNDVTLQDMKREMKHICQTH